MLVTVMIVAGMLYSSLVAFTLNYAQVLVWPVMLSLVAVLGLQFNKNKYPLNYYWLFGFTIIESLLVGFVCTV